MRLPCLILMVAVLSSASSSRPNYHTMVIDDDNLFSAYIYPGKPVSFFYLLQQDVVEVLSFTVTPCTAPVAWEIAIRNSNETGRVVVADQQLVRPADSKPRVWTLSPAYRGLYTLLLSVKEETWVQVYVTYLSHPQKLRPTAPLRLVNRRVNGQIFVRWRQTTMDPEDTEYVLVVHKGEEPLESLCRAGGELSGVKRPLDWSPPQGSVPGVEFRPPRRNDIIMERVGKRTSWLVKGLEPKVRYQLEVFALNTATNFSYRYGKAPNVTYRRPRPLPLQDGKLAVIELRRSEPRAAFRFKVKEGGRQRLEVAVTACGSSGTVLAELRQRGSVHGDKATISGHGVLAINSPQPGGVFILRLRLLPGYRVLQVQVIGTTKGLEEPELPQLALVYEYRGLRGCSQLVLGWVPVPGEAHYCITATQVKRRDIFHRLPDQCSVEQALNSLAHSVLQCTMILPKENQTVITEPITNLKPGKQYDIQVSVKKGNSRVLSYELIRVRTKNSCK